MIEPSNGNGSCGLLERLVGAIDPVVAGILDRALDGKELSAEEGTELLKITGRELNALMLAADEVRRRAVGDIVTYVVNRNINFTNVCTTRCEFCAFSTTPDSPDAFILPLEEIARRAEEAWKMGATEVCIQGGLHPDLDAAFYHEVCRAVKRVAPDIHVHAFSPMEIVYGAAKSNLSIDEHLKVLKEAGLDSLPGTAAEILDDKIRSIICPKKIDTGTWVKVIKTAHRLGIPTTSTIMYGHVEDAEHRSRHIALLREIQKETHGFTEFVPLGFVHQNTPIYRKGLARPGPTGAEDVKVHAVARLMLNGYINNVQVSWVKLGPKLAQICLNAGANDFGGTLIEENISKAAGATTGQHMTPEQIRRIIKDMRRTPAQRTTIYGHLKIVN
ncbi:MAG TPA: 5-amino-6-(D-ribitylamino)uracil--L-tyrosine 4-hydroxyphenyl transferase CofH [Candidatus Bathyarchaeia archaeon]|nr:5-amino-6-(D-ribitylamino)uracil--L-tyrosine 4-hydroxyphenyl transferase CofH [Candidatus Bathyarchaeia archaeon]